MRTPERDMVLDCYNFFKEVIGFKNVLTEVPFLSRCIDMVLINENDVVFTIEFKMSNVRQAVKQAYDHSLGADYAFICMPENKKINIELLKDKNIGLFLYNSLVKNKVRTAYMPVIGKNKVSLFGKILFENTIKILSAEAANV